MHYCTNWANHGVLYISAFVNLLSPPHFTEPPYYLLSLLSFCLYFLLLACLLNAIVYLKTLSMPLTAQRRMIVRLVDKGDSVERLRGMSRDTILEFAF